MKHVALAVILFMAAMRVHAVALPPDLGRHASTQADRAAISALLDQYTRSVTDGDEAAFRALLLDDDIPFSAVSTDASGKAVTARTLRRYADFRDAVFRRGRHYRQTFHNVRIDQDGSLAQVSLDFVTRQGDGGGYGWKVLHLVKTPDGWKIASEFFTVRDLP